MRHITDFLASDYVFDEDGIVDTFSVYLGRGISSMVAKFSAKKTDYTRENKLNMYKLPNIIGNTLTVGGLAVVGVCVAGGAGEVAVQEEEAEHTGEQRSYDDAELGVVEQFGAVGSHVAKR